jgi:glycosidase
MGKTIIYQLLVRLFGNQNTADVPNGTIEENGCGKFNDITDKALIGIKNLGATHVWLTGVIEHAKTTNYQQFGIEPYPSHLVKGKAGSPYAIVDYYDVDPDLAVDVPNRMAEFDALLARCHANGLKAFIDFVPNHLARIYHSDAKPAGVADFGANDDINQVFSPQNNFYYLPGAQFIAPSNAQSAVPQYIESPAKVTGNDCVTATPSVNDWYETVKLNYGVDLFHGRIPHFDPLPDTWHKMLDILLFWADKGIDGFRVDMAEMVPVSFWHYAVHKVKERYPQLVFLGEVYNPALYHDFIDNGGFDWLYDKVGMYDTLRDVVEERRGAFQITEAWEAISPIHKHMLFFMENHDEQRIASSFFAGDAFKGWPAFFVAATLSTNPVMVYFGQEVGVDGMDQEGFSGLDGRTTIFDYWGVRQFQNYSNQGAFDGGELTDPQKKLFHLYLKLLNISKRETALAKGGLYDLQYANTSNASYNTSHVFSYVRHTPDSVVLCVCNFSSTVQSVRIIIPEHAFDIVGLDKNGYFNAIDLLGDSRRINFPGQVAIAGGAGLKLDAYQTLVFRLK